MNKIKSFLEWFADWRVISMLAVFLLVFLWGSGLFQKDTVITDKPVIADEPKAIESAQASQPEQPTQKVYTQPQPSAEPTFIQPPTQFYQPIIPNFQPYDVSDSMNALENMKLEIPTPTQPSIGHYDFTPNYNSPIENFLGY